MPPFAAVTTSSMTATTKPPPPLLSQPQATGELGEAQGSSGATPRHELDSAARHRIGESPPSHAVPPHRCVPVRVNKFGEFYQNSPKFDGFGPHQISKLVILLFTDLKYLKKIKKYKKIEWILSRPVKIFFKNDIV
jgi:hypothetical protein